MRKRVSRIQRTFADLRRAGPTLEVFLEPVLGVQEMRRRDGEDVPSVPLRALLDTGASGTVVKSSAMQRLGLAPIGTARVHTPSTVEPVVVFEYRVRLVFSKSLAFETDVVETPMGEQNIECLIGRDILEAAVLTYDGPKNRFTLTFPRQDDDDNS